MQVHENTILKGNTSTQIVMFDLDDTLVVTDAKIKVVSSKSGKVLKELTPAEFNSYEAKPTHVLSFEDFDNPEILRQGKIIHNIFRQLKKFYEKNIPIAIVTARSDSNMVRNFFLRKGIDIHPDLCIAVNDPKYKYKGRVEERKQEAMIEIISNGFNYVVFFDDHSKNLEEAKKIEKILKGVSITTVKV
jgi:hypothetical protein